MRCVLEYEQSETQNDEEVRRNFISEEQFSEMNKSESINSVSRQSSLTINRYAPYKNKLEQTFAYGLVLERRIGLIQAWAYEVMTLKLAKGKYHRPDFTIWHRDGSIEQAAVKGYHKNLRDSLTIIKWACKEHPWFRFTINRRDGSAWSKERVEGWTNEFGLGLAHSGSVQNATTDVRASTVNPPLPVKK